MKKEYKLLPKKILSFTILIIIIFLSITIQGTEGIGYYFRNKKVALRKGIDHRRGQTTSPAATQRIWVGRRQEASDSAKAQGRAYGHQGPAGRAINRSRQISALPFTLRFLYPAS